MYNNPSVHSDHRANIGGKIADICKIGGAISFDLIILYHKIFRSDDGYDFRPTQKSTD